MGQHKNSNRKPLAPRFILTTKWNITNGVTKEDMSRFTPIGTYEYYLRRRKQSGVPFSYGSQSEAENALREIVSDRKLAVGVSYSILEVKYVPSKIKMYDMAWYKKYVINEFVVTIDEAKTETIK